MADRFIAGGSSATEHGWRGNIFVILFVATTAQTLAAFGMFTIPTLAATIKGALGLSPSMIGYQTSLAFGMSGVSAVLIGGFVRRFGPCRVFQAGLMFLAAGGALVIASSMATVTAGIALIGFGFGFASPVTSIILARFGTAARRNLLFSIKQSSTPLGAAIAGIVSPTLAESWTWQWAFGVTVIAALLSALCLNLFHRTWDNEADHKARIALPWEGIRIIFANRTLLRMASIGFCYAMAQLGLTAFLVLFLVEDLAFSVISAGLILSMVHGVGVVSRLIWGFSADRAGNVLAVLSFIGGLTAVCAAIAVFASPEWPLVSIYALFLVFGSAGFAWSGLQAAAMAAMAESDRLSETISGGFGFLFLGAWAGPVLAALVFSVSENYGAVFGFLCLSAVIGAVLAGFGSRTQNR